MDDAVGNGSFINISCIYIQLKQCICLSFDWCFKIHSFKILKCSPLCQLASPLTLVWSLPEPAADPQQVSDLVDRLIRNRNPGAVFTTTERADVTWQTLRSITYSPTLGQGAVGSASVQDASLVRRWEHKMESCIIADAGIFISRFKGRITPPINSAPALQLNITSTLLFLLVSWIVKSFME